MVHKGKSKQKSNKFSSVVSINSQQNNSAEAAHNNIKESTVFGAGDTAVMNSGGRSVGAGDSSCRANANTSNLLYGTDPNFLLRPIMLRRRNSGLSFDRHGSSRLPSSSSHTLASRESCFSDPDDYSDAFENDSDTDVTGHLSAVYSDSSEVTLDTVSINHGDTNKDTLRPKKHAKVSKCLFPPVSHGKKQPLSSVSTGGTGVRRSQVEKLPAIVPLTGKEKVRSFRGTGLVVGGISAPSQPKRYEE